MTYTELDAIIESKEKWKKILEQLRQVRVNIFSPCGYCILSEHIKNFGGGNQSFAFFSCHNCIMYHLKACENEKNQFKKIKLAFDNLSDEIIKLLEIFDERLEFISTIQKEYIRQNNNNKCFLEVKK